MLHVVLVNGSRGVVVGRFLIVPPTGELLSNPCSTPIELSVRHPLLEDEREDLENDLLMGHSLSMVPTGVLWLLSSRSCSTWGRGSLLTYFSLLESLLYISASIPEDNADAMLLFSLDGVLALLLVPLSSDPQVGVACG